ncbi:hypothetical protein POM88_043711 [Heracleum sosnowskyi]|uniref:Uncharacterized protein n=1 Tax=Heracleum sosnowskyi TaxID=360622 RepID=A0AAD8M4I7_9APIA|nr:hypothetical protein POM88_043711 [Heracleum sosnowskyi]
MDNNIQQGNERMILVRAFNENDGKMQCGDVEESYGWEDFHIVDLSLNKIYRNCLPSLPRACGRGNMVALGKSIFIFGGLDSFSKHSPLFKFVKSSPESHFHMGASHLHFDPLDLKDGLMVRAAWSPAPLMNTPHSYTPTCLNGDVYSFGNIHCSPEVLYVDNANVEVLGPWKLLYCPPELVKCTPCLSAIPDPTKNRILVHFYGGQLPSPSLYAFYPPDRQNQDGETGIWQCLNSNFPGWDKVVDAVLLDGVILLHGRKFPDLLSAYEVDTGRWLDVQWSTRVIEEDLSIEDCYFGFDSLFCLDDTNKILCLAVYSPIEMRSDGEDDDDDDNSPSKTSLFFFKFRVERRHSTISLTPLYTRSFEIESTTEVLNFLLL